MLAFYDVSSYIVGVLNTIDTPSDTMRHLV
jgi:hypothetical protein